MSEPAAATPPAVPRLEMRGITKRYPGVIANDRIKAGQPAWFQMSQQIEALVKAEKKLNPNVDFYAATVYHMLGIPTDLMTPIFALARMAGWTAHVREQYVDNRIIRPGSVYVGPTDRRWSPIASR